MTEPGRTRTLRFIRIGMLATIAVGSAVLLAANARARRDANREIRHPPVVVTSPIKLPGSIVVGATSKWYQAARGPVRYGDPKPVVITAYCLKGTTRRGRYVRAGIVAADPRLFPLSRYIELYVGSEYLGRFLVDDTGKNIRGARLDIWMPTCREAVLFGRRRGTAVLVPRKRVAALQAGAPSSH